MAGRRNPSRKAKGSPVVERTGRPANAVELPSHSKGRRPAFYEDPAIDQLFAIVTALTAEVSVLFDHIDTLEHVLVAARALAPDAVGAYVAGGEDAELRSRRRDELLRRVFAVFESYAARETTKAG